MKTKLTYHEENGYLYPGPALQEQTHYLIGKYGNLHLAYIKAHKKGIYTTLLTTCKLNEYLHKVDEQAREQVRKNTADFANRRGIGEALKSADPMRWVQEMNNCKAAAEEIILKEIIFQ